MPSSFKKKGHLFDNTPPPQKNNGTIEPRETWVHHQQLVTLLKVHQLSWFPNTDYELPSYIGNFTITKKHVVSSVTYGWNRMLNNLGISITPAPSSKWDTAPLPWQPLLPGNLGLNIRQLGELFRSQIPQKFWVNDWNQHTKEIWWIGETPWKRKHWKHQELVFHSTGPTPMIGFKLGEWNLIQFFRDKLQVQPSTHLTVLTLMYIITLPGTIKIIESFPSVVKCPTPVPGENCHHRDIVRSL